MRQLEEAMPMWLLECLLQNKIPAIPITKVSFVLLPYREPDGEQLPELLNTCVSTFAPPFKLGVDLMSSDHNLNLPRAASCGCAS